MCTNVVFLLYNFKYFGKYHLSYIIPLILNGKKRQKRPKLTKLWKLSRTILIWFLLAKFTAIFQYLPLHFVFKFRKNQRIHLILVNWLSKNMFLSFELLKDIKVYIKITTILFHDNNAFKADSPFKSFIAKGGSQIIKMEI